MIDRQRLVKTFTDLVRIDSPSGDEEAIAQDLTQRLTTLGFHVTRDDYGNVIASEDGDDPLLLSAHMDTVEPGRGVKPIIDGDKIHTDETTILGGDCKAGLATILEALESIKADGLQRVPVQVVLSRDEELGLLGAKNLDFSTIRAKQAVVFDGDGPVNQITSGSPTYVAFDIDIVGRAAHAGVEPENGISAIRIAAEIIVQLQQGRLDENTTLNVGMIQGGSVRNAVPEHATFAGETRSHNPEALDRVQSYLLNVLQETRGRYPEAVIAETFNTEFEAYTVDPGEPVAMRVIQALAAQGLQPELVLSGGGTDGNVFRSNGINAVVLGVADHAAHTVREHVFIPELEQAAAFCRALLITES